MKASASMNVDDSDNDGTPPDTADDYCFSDVITDNTSTIFAAATILRQANFGNAKNDAVCPQSV